MGLKQDLEAQGISFDDMMDESPEALLRALCGDSTYLDGAIEGVSVPSSVIDSVDSASESSFIVSGFNNSVVVNGAGGYATWSVEQASGIASLSNDSTIVLDKDITDGWIGGYITVTDTGARFEARAIIEIDGVAGDERGFSYLRNSGAAYDFAPLEIATMPFTATAGQEVRVRVVQRQGNTYGSSGTLAGVIRGNQSKLWIKG